MNYNTRIKQKPRFIFITPTVCPRRNSLQSSAFRKIITNGLPKKKKKKSRRHLACLLRGIKIMLALFFFLDYYILGVCIQIKTFVSNTKYVLFSLHFVGDFNIGSNQGLGRFFFSLKSFTVIKLGAFAGIFMFFFSVKLYTY